MATSTATAAAATIAGANIATQQSKKGAESSILTSPDGPPLDFSFKNIKDLKELKMMDPRPGGGKRKPIPQEEEENKDEKQKDDEKEQNKNGDEHEQKQEKEEDQEQKEGGEDPESKNKQKKEEKKEEKKQPEVIRAIPNQNTAAFQNTVVTMASGTVKNAPGGTLVTDTQANANKKLKRVKLICTSFIISYNKIRSLQGFYQIIDQVMYDCKNLAWIDLSHNFLTSIDYDFADFPQIKSLYLHCNYLPNLRELEKLAHLPLRSLTIHGNPIETIPNFRLYIIALLPSLKRLDSVLISKKERDNANVWINEFRHVKIPEVKNPPVPVDDTAQSNQNQTGKQSQ